MPTASRETERSHQGRAAGFSLIEIIITMAIIASLGALIMINMGTLTKNERLKLAARKLAGLSAYVRSQATDKARKAYFEFDFVANSYRMRMDPAQDGFGRFIEPEDGHVLSEDEIEEWDESFEWEDLPRDVYFRRLYLSSKSYYDAKTGIVTSTYQADGTLQSYILWIQGTAEEGREGPYYSIVVNGLTGSGEVLKGAASYPEAKESDFSDVMGPDAPGGGSGEDTRKGGDK